MGNEQVLVAIVIEIAGIDAHAGFGVAIRIDRRARHKCPVEERAVLLVQPQLVVFIVVGDINVDPSIPVEVGGYDPQGRCGRRFRERRGGGVGEGAVPLIAI